MAFLLAYPMRLDGTSFATVEDGTEDQYAQMLAMMISTDTEERQLAPEYGIGDPTFGQFSRAELEAKIADFGPPVVIDEFEVVQRPGDKVQVNFTFYTDDSIDDEQFDDTEETDLDEFALTDATD